MKIVLLESLAVPQETISELAKSFLSAGHSFEAYTDGKYDTQTIISRAKDADAIIVANTKLPAEAVEMLTNLKLISVAFTGVDHIPMDLCREKNIMVCNCAGYSTESVAELVFGMLIALQRRIIPCNQVVREEGTKAGLVGFELKGKTFGIIGSGAIGLRTAELAKAFGCKLIAYSRTERKEAKDMGITYVSLEELMKQSDIVSLHVPATKDTTMLINKDLIAMMKPTAVLINTARGTVVDNEALANALNEGKIAGAGIDVFEVEPPIAKEHPLCGAKNAVLTPHIAFATAESMVIRADMAFENVDLWLSGTPRNIMK